MPVPDKLTDSALKVSPPESSNAAPLDTVVPPAVVPNAAALLALNTPSLIVVAPV